MKSSLFTAVIRISRPVNVFIGALSIFIAAFISGSLSPWYKVLLACLSGGIIAAAANTINDYFDLEIDRINKPARPLPAGQVSPASARRWAFGEFLLGIFLSFFINLPAFGIALTISLLLYLYSARLKRMPLWGNLAVSFSSAMAFIYGGVAVHRVKQTLIPAAFAFFFHLGREIIKDVQDMEGDRRYNARTFPLAFGKSAALLLVTLNFLFLIILTILPYLLHWYGKNYFLAVTIGVNPVLIYSAVTIWRNQSFEHLGFVSNLLKADMLVGLFAIYLG